MLDVTANYGTPLDFVAIFGYFAYIIVKHTLLSNIHVKLSLIVCLILSIHTFWLANMPNVTASYARFSGLMFDY